MGVYTRHHLVLLLALLAAGGLGLGVRHWRAAHPDAAMRLERVGLRHGGGGGTLAVARPPTRSPERARIVASETPIDINRATADDLTRLPGIGPALAARIVAARRAAAFDSVDDLLRVKGLGRSRIERLRPLVSLTRPAGDGGPAPGKGE